MAFKFVWQSALLVIILCVVSCLSFRLEIKVSDIDDITQTLVLQGRNDLQAREIALAAESPQTVGGVHVGDSPIVEASKRFDDEDYLTAFKQADESWFSKPLSTLKLHVGSTKSAKDEYVAATKQYTGSLYV